MLMINLFIVVTFKYNFIETRRAKHEIKFEQEVGKQRDTRYVNKPLNAIISEIKFLIPLQLICTLATRISSNMDNL